MKLIVEKVFDLKLKKLIGLGFEKITCHFYMPFNILKNCKINYKERN
ncbi:MAG: hypothetical protein ACOXZS_01100 [Bacilli bacterium]